MWQSAEKLFLFCFLIIRKSLQVNKSVKFLKHHTKKSMQTPQKRVEFSFLLQNASKKQVNLNMQKISEHEVYW